MNGRVARMVSRMTRRLILFCHTLIFAYPYHLRAELLGAATEKLKPRWVAASEAGAERVSNPRLSATIFCAVVVGSKQDFRFRR